MKLKFYIIGLALLAMSACKKDATVTPVVFDATSVNTTGAASSSFTTSAAIQFNFAGNPDIISFYSGEPGKNYNFRNRVTAPGVAQLQFSSLRANGSQAASLSVLVSADFKGVATNLIYGVLTRDTATTNANIAAATWTDVTSRATLSTGTATATPSGLVDLSDFAKQGKPVYIAFKYTASVGSTQNKWTISGLTINNVLSDGSVYTIANLNAPTTAYSNYGNAAYGPGWAVSYDLAKNSNKYAWVFTDKTSLVITGATNAALATAPAEAWAITGPLDLSRVTPDAGVGIKNFSALQPNFSYTFTTPGKYTSVFVASNNAVGAANTVVKQIPLTITP